MLEKLSSIACLACLSFCSLVQAADWPQWGGPQRDLVWREKNIVDKLPAGNLPRVWSAPIAAGYAGPPVAEGCVYITDRVAEEHIERMHCFDSKTGNSLRTHIYPARYSTSYPLGPRATPTVDGDRVYTLGAMGDLFCLVTANGDVLWPKNLPADFGTKLPTWGMAGAPLAEGDQLIVLVRDEAESLIVSFEKLTGRELWRSLADKAVGYCSPIILELGGQRLVWHPEAVSAINPANGKFLWEVPFQVNYGLCIPTPLKLGQRLFITSFYNGPLMIDLGPTGTVPKILWQTANNSTEIKNNALHATICTPWLTETALIGVVGSYGEMHCLNPETGDTLWETYNYGKLMKLLATTVGGMPS